MIRLLSLRVSLANGNGLLHCDFIPVLSNIHDESLYEGSGICQFYQHKTTEEV